MCTRVHGHWSTGRHRVATAKKRLKCIAMRSSYGAWDLGSLTQSDSTTRCSRVCGLHAAFGPVNASLAQPRKLFPPAPNYESPKLATTPPLHQTILIESVDTAAIMKSGKDSKRLRPSGPTRRRNKKPSASGSTKSAPKQERSTAISRRRQAITDKLRNDYDRS